MYNCEGKLFCCPVRDLNDPEIIFEKFQKDQEVAEDIFNDISDYITQTGNVSELNEKSMYFTITSYYHKYRIGLPTEFDKCLNESFVFEKILNTTEKFLKLLAENNGKVCEIFIANLKKFFNKSQITEQNVECFLDNYKERELKNTSISFSPSDDYRLHLIHSAIGYVSPFEKRKNLAFFFLKRLDNKIDETLARLFGISEWDSLAKSLDMRYYILKNHMNLVLKFFHFYELPFSTIISTFLDFLKYKRIDMVFGKKSEFTFFLKNCPYYLSEDQKKIILSLLTKICGYNHTTSSKFSGKNQPEQNSICLEIFGYHGYLIADEYDERVKNLKREHDRKMCAVEQMQILKDHIESTKLKIQQLVKNEEEILRKKVETLSEFSGIENSIMPTLAEHLDS